MGAKKQILDTAVTFGRQIALLLLGVLLLPILTRLLGPVGLGAYTLILAVLSIAVTLGGGGIGVAIVYFATNQRLPTDKLSPIVRKQIGLGLLVGGILLVGSIPFWINSSSVQGYQAAAIGFLVVAFVAAVLTVPLESILRFRKKFSLLAMIHICVRASFFLCILLLLLFGIKDFRIFLVVLAGQYVLSGLVISYFASRSKQSLKEGPENDVSFGEFSTYTFKSAGSNVVAQLNYRLDVLLLSCLTTDIQLGIYGVAVMIAEKLWMLSKSVGEVSLCYLPRSDSGENELVRQALVAAKFTGIVTVLICVVLCAALPILPAVLGDDRFDGAGMTILLLTPGIIALGVSRIISNALTMLGRQGLNLSFGIVGVVLNVIANVILIPEYGAAGAAVATSISYSFLLSCRILYLKSRSYSLRPFYTVTGSEISYATSFLSKSFHGSQST